ncbi:triose-phosphate isomerase [bacterium]|nr:triose-phosphate isomerase [bacterium]
MRRPIIAGNWKMNMTGSEALELVEGIKEELKEFADAEVVVCPPFTSLEKVARTIKDTEIQLGAQNVYSQEKGAYTGEISVLMLKDSGCRYVICGHSERREYFKEDNELINAKVKAVLAGGLFPILCVGERLEEREAGRHKEVVYAHLTGGLKNLSREEMAKIVIAYEPVWAIGTGKTATPQDAQDMHLFIRQTLTKMYTQELANEIRIQYGGSVKPDNVDELMKQPDIDGALVGGASLEAGSFARIVKFSLPIT